MKNAGTASPQNHQKHPSQNRKHKTVVTSGGFDPIHIGHVRLIQEAAKLGGKLIILLNNDNWLLQKKGFVFMPEKERREILLSIQGVDDVVLSHHKKNPTDMSVAEDLKKLKPDIFAKGGDRDPHNMPSRETIIAEKIGCKVIYNLGAGGKVQSSSWLVANSVKNAPCPCRSGKMYTACGLKDTPEHKRLLKKLLNS